ncbi:MAG: UDP-N-acetylmuramoyl-tripeptide--D-alanyl-D-alanine ligase [Actinobacteria bacterium]|uniref:UDP-MurNAc-pentapeptide synthetase n=1 Tax=freshwater metagenome TaxID=449393 RepID=A0A6J6GE90_9ZZZZ|nr:UDP-N-acetylmuramoyl-tripeptide--D-alanyl-D-alanine ligase [Actinomycetota bacterium]
MIPLSLANIAEIVQGELCNVADPNKIVNLHAVIDSRKADSNTFFAALQGENADGHDFAESAIKNGAEFALLSRDLGLSSILVDDVTIALSHLAQSVRSQLPNLKVIAITGSQGKTTTKDLLQHLLSAVGESVANEASLNNELGVPLTLLRCNKNTKFCVVEMGARHRGDIAHLMEIAAPDVGLVLVVGKAHIGEFGSQEEIAETKAELIAGLADTSVAVLGTYDRFTPHMADGRAMKVISFGEKSSCLVRAADIELREGRAHFDLVTPEGRQAVGLQLLGMHQVANALGAAAAATALGISLETISAALSTAEVASKWRMALMQEDELLLINDSYNANPESMAAALRTLVLLAQERGGATWAILGKMHELGESSIEEHQSIGRLASDIGVDHLVSVGTRDFLSAEGDGEMVQHYFSDIASAVEITTHFSAGDVVLVKASRAEGFEVLAEQIMSAWKASE